MSKFIKNCSNIINWYEVVVHLEDNYKPIIKKADPRYWLEPNILEPDYVQSNNEKSTDAEMCKGWVDANYFFESAVWLIYRADRHYSCQIENLVCEYLNIDLCSSMISRIDPGCTVPIHFDPDDDLDQTGGKKIRYICQISPPSHGQVLMIGDQAFTNLAIGDIYQWGHYLDLHSAANTGLTPVYYFSILGFRRD